MGILTSLFTGPIISAIADGLFGKLEAGWEAYVKKEISKDQLLAQMQAALLATFKDVEIAFYDSLTKTYTAFIQAASANPVMARAWSVVLYSQLFVLIWHQLAIPALATYGIPYKSSGATVDWAYALVALCLGAPAIASRVGPAAGMLTDGLKKLVGK
jgi:hypothetical protein